MKKTTASLLAGIAGLALSTASVNAQILMFENWNDAPLGDIHPTSGSGYTGAWSNIGFNALWPGGHTSVQPVNSLAEIRTDSNNLFGRGTDNQVLFLDAAAGINMNFSMPTGVQVATLSYEMYVTGFHSVGTSRLTTRFYDEGGGTIINHGLQRRTASSADFRFRNEAERFDLNTTYRFEVVVNNSENTINVGGPDGAHDIDSGMTAVWVNGSLSTIYNYGQTANSVRGDIGRIAMETFTDNTWSAYVDEVSIREGAFVIPEPSTYALIFGLLALSGAAYVRRRK